MFKKSLTLLATTILMQNYFQPQFPPDRLAVILEVAKFAVNVAAVHND